METAIETTGLAKRYGRVQALKPVTISIGLGRCFGLLGPNGAGKSTFVKTLLGIVRPSAGSARLLGRDFRSAQARRAVGYLPEGHRFPRYLTGRGVCRYFGKLAGMGGKELDAEIDAKLALVGMGEWGDTKVTKYSKGMMQRVGLAQAMLGDPTLVFLDEPTDGVDPVGRQQMREVVRRYAGAGRTIFLNSHLLAEVELVCDEIGILHKGEMIQHGSVTEIKQSVQRPGGTLLRVQTDPLPEPLWSRLAARGAAAQPDQWFTIAVDSRPAIPALIDELRAAGVGVYAVQPVQANLEDAFIKLVAEQDDTSVGGSQS